MELSIALCDDTPAFLDKLASQVQAYAREHADALSVRYRLFHSGVELMAACESGRHFDVVLLDIIMPLASGIETAKVIRTLDKAVRIIFLTSSPEYALESYRVKAFSYLLKTYQERELFSLLDEAAADAWRSIDTELVVKSRAGLRRLPLSGLVGLEVFRKKLTFHTLDGAEYEFTGTLAEVERDLLVDTRFFKPHRSFIINMDHIAGFEPYSAVMATGWRVPIPRENYAKAKADYLSYACSRSGA